MLDCDKIDKIFELYVCVIMMVLNDYVGVVMELC